jgi:hypothetical protein
VTLPAPTFAASGLDRAVHGTYVRPRVLPLFVPRSPLAVLAALVVLAPIVERSIRAQAGAAIPVAIVFVSRQMPDRSHLGRGGGDEQLGVGSHSRFRPAAPGRLLVREADGTIRTLIDGGVTSATTPHLIDVNAPDVSYDGQWIAFAGLRPGQHASGPGAHPGAWRIYAIRVDGTGLRQVSPEEERSAIALAGLRGYDDTDPAWLPDGRLVFSSTRWPSYAQFGGVRTTNLHVIGADGTGLRRITAERNGADRPLVDPLTGKIVYARWWRNHRIAVDDVDAVVEADAGYVQKDGLAVEGAQLAGEEARTGRDLRRNAWHAATINPDGSQLAMWSGTFRDEDANHAYGGAFSPEGTFFANYFPSSTLVDAAGAGGIRRLTRGPQRYTSVAGVTVRPDAARAGSAARRARGGPVVTEPEVLPDGRLVVSVTTGPGRDYGLATMNADGSGLQALFDVRGAAELRARAIRPRPLPPVLADLHAFVPSAYPPPAEGPYDAAGTFVFDALNVYFNAPVDTDIVSAPPIGSASTIRFFVDHQRVSPGSVPNRDWPVLLKELPVSPGGAVRDDAAPASLPLFEQMRSRRGDAALGRVPLTGGPYPDGAAHVAGMNFAPAKSVARCVGCHAGHTMIPVPSSFDAATWTNLAPGARIEVSSTRDAAVNGGLVDRLVMKGGNARQWTAAGGQHAGQWVKLTFPVAVRVRRVRLYNPGHAGEARSSLTVQGAAVRLFSDEAATVQVAQRVVGALAASGTDVDFAPTVVRAVRVDLGPVTGTFNGLRTAGLAEIEVIASGDLGRQGGPTPPASRRAP